MVAAANHALTAPLTGGNIIDGIRPGIIALIQTHSDSLDWNPHLHMIVTNGLVDYTNVKCPTFQAVKRWEIYRGQGLTVLSYGGRRSK